MVAKNLKDKMKSEFKNEELTTYNLNPVIYLVPKEGLLNET